MSIDPKQPVPLYYQLKTLLVEEILDGRYAPAGRLPTEHELCDRYRISRTPVSRALSELAEEGVILRHRRRGTFVNPRWLRRRPDQPEVRIVVPEGPWGQLIRDAALDDRAGVEAGPCPGGQSRRGAAGRREEGALRTLSLAVHVHRRRRHVVDDRLDVGVLRAADARDEWRSMALADRQAVCERMVANMEAAADDIAVVGEAGPERLELVRV
jgi:DNA-binding transcriptional regulator YhcF (GntR family)